MRYLANTLKLSIYGLLWGFPVPIILALLLNRIERVGIKKKIQLVLYMPNFVSVIVLCGIVRIFLSVTGPVNLLLGTQINFMTMPSAFRTIYIASGIWQGRRLGFHHVYGGLSNASKELKEAACDRRRQHLPADQGCGMAGDQGYGTDPVHHVRSVTS